MSETLPLDKLASLFPHQVKMLPLSGCFGWCRWNIKQSSRIIPWDPSLGKWTMKLTTIALAAVLAFGSTPPLAQSGGGGSSGGGSSGTSGRNASSTGAATSSAGTSSSYVNGTGGSPGLNTSDALSHGTSGNSMGTTGSTAPSANSGAPSGK